MALSCIFTIPTFCILVSYGFASDIEKSRSVHWAIKSGSYYSAGNAQAKPSSARNSRTSKVQSNGSGISSLIGSKFSPEQTKNIEKNHIDCKFNLLLDGCPGAGFYVHFLPDEVFNYTNIT